MATSSRNCKLQPLLWNVYSGGSRIFLRGPPTPQVGVITYNCSNFLPKMKEFWPRGSAWIRQWYQLFVKTWKYVFSNSRHRWRWQETHGDGDWAADGWESFAVDLQLLPVDAEHAESPSLPRQQDERRGARSGGRGKRLAFALLAIIDKYGIPISQ